MCGIAGCYALTQNYRVAEDKLQSIAQTLNKRGPNYQGFAYYKNKLALVHARLSIIDTSSNAHQPMEDETGRYAIVFNGEIYNFKSLKEKLPSSINYKSTSDTEVLLYAYIHFGKEFLHQLNVFLH